MPDFDIARYARLQDRLATDPDIELGELDVKQIPQRWFTDHGGYTAWEGEPFHGLAAWADDEGASDIPPAQLLAEAERMLTEITGLASTPHWASVDRVGSRQDASAAVAALIRYLSIEVHTYANIAERLYADYDEDPYVVFDISKTEAKTIAGGWATMTYLPDLAIWAHSANTAGPDEPVDDFTVLAAQANTLWTDLGNNAARWPHAGRPESSITAAIALFDYLTCHIPA